jgi:hypothetical protein
MMNYGRLVLKLHPPVVFPVTVAASALGSVLAMILAAEITGGQNILL